LNIWYDNQRDSSDDYDEVEAQAYHDYYKTYSNINFGSVKIFDSDQSDLNDTTTATPLYLYDDRCTSFETKFGGLESNETNHESKSRNHRLHRSHTPIGSWKAYPP